MPTPPEELAALRRQWAELARRIERIEEQLGIAGEVSTASATAGAPAATPEASPAPTVYPAPPEQATGTGPGLIFEAVAEAPAVPVRSLLDDIATPAPPPPARPEAPAEPGPIGGWMREGEALLGGRVALWAGCGLVFLAMAFALPWAWAHLSEPARLALGLGTGAALIGAGSWARRQSESWFGEGLCGAGLAILYLTLWAGVQRYGLLGFTFGFALMALTTALGVALAVRYDAVSLSALATVGGFATPALLQSQGTGPSQAVPLLAYIAVLNGGILAVSLFRRWSGIIRLSFAATLLLLAGWAQGSYVESLAGTLFPFITLYFFLFLGAACFRSLIQREETRPEDLLLLFADASIFAVVGYALVTAALGPVPGVFPLALALLFGLLQRATAALAPANRSLRESAGGLALLFLTTAVPIQMRQGWIAIGWSVEAAVLVTLAMRLNSRLFLVAGQIVWGLSLPVVLWVLAAVDPASPYPVVNERGLPLLVAVVAAGWVALYGHERQAAISKDLITGHALAAVLGGAWLIAQETWLLLGSPSGAWAGDGAQSGLYLVACELSAYAGATVLLGLRLRHPGLRLGGYIVALPAVLLAPMAMAALPGSETPPFVSLRALAALASTGMLYGIARALESSQNSLEQAEAGIPPALAVPTSIVALWGLSVEVYSAFSSWSIPSEATCGTAACLALVILWGPAAALLLRGGFRGSAGALGGLSLLVLLVAALASSGSGWMPVLNLRFAAFAVAAGASSAAAALARRRGSAPGSPDAGLPGSLLALAGVLVLWCLTQETYELFHYLGSPGRQAQVGISLVWTLCGGALFVAGLRRRWQPARLAALGLLALTALKLFLLDLSFVEMPGRFYSFLGLGVTLIGISWLYSRYGLGKDG